MRTQHLLLIFLIGIAFSCTNKKPDSVSTIDTLVVNFYADSLVWSEEVKLGGRDSAVFALGIDSLYRIHGVSRENVHTSIGKYQKDLSTWKEFYEMLVKRLEYLRTRE
jgi:hypothetical protein